MGANREVLRTIRQGQADLTHKEGHRFEPQEGDDCMQEAEKLFDSVKGPKAIDIDMEAIEELVDN